MSLLIVASERFADHVTPPGHPERVERAEVMDAVAARGRRRGAIVSPPTAAGHEGLLAVHSPEHVRRIEATAGRSVALDPDTFTSPSSCDVARQAAGAACAAVDHAWREGAPSAALVRPPGHHAERDRAMGFCLFNNVAVAAAHARRAGAARVAIVDFDVHHGNGTQWIFYDDPAVLFVSLHQFPFYPGTGAAGEIGRGHGRGFTVNVPIEAGAGDADYDVAFRAVVRPVLREFRPDLLLVSAGFDAHEDDPLGGMRLTVDGFAGLVRHLWCAAAEHARGRLVLVTEGGYDLAALGRGLDLALDVVTTSPEEPTPVRGPAGRGETAVAAARAALRDVWPAL